MGSIVQLKEEQVAILTSDLSLLINKFDSNIKAASKIDDLTEKIKTLEENLTNSLAQVDELVNKTQTKDEEVSNFIKQVSYSSNDKLFNELSNSFDNNKKLLDKYWRETKEQLLVRRKDLIEIADDSMNRLENIFSGDKLALIIEKNVEKEYFTTHEKLESTVKNLQNISLKSISQAVECIENSSKQLNTAKERFDLANQLIESKNNKKQFFKGVFFVIFLNIIFILPFLYFFTSTFDSIKNDYITLKNNSNPIDNSILNIYGESFFIIDKKEDFIILRKK